MTEVTAAELAVRLEEDGLIAYCHSGQRSALAVEILRAAGYEARNYRGSWHEWSRDPALPSDIG